MQPDLNLRWAHMPKITFVDVAPQIQVIQILLYYLSLLYVTIQHATLTVCEIVIQ